MPSRMWKNPSWVNMTKACYQSRIKVDDADIGMDIEGPLRPSGGRKRIDDVDLEPKTRQPRPDREIGPVRPRSGTRTRRRGAPAPIDLGVRRQRAALDMGERLIVLSNERSEGSDTRAARKARLGEASAVLVELDEVADPESGRLFQSACRCGKIQEAVAFSGMSMSRSDFIGARTSRVRVFPSGFRNVSTVTSSGTS